MKKIGLIGIIGIIGFLGGVRQLAHAQNLALSISPPILEVMIKPGKTITQIYKITNDGEQVLITPKLYELGFAGIKEDANYTAEKWISIVSNEISFNRPFLLHSQKQAEFILKISPLAGTQEQDYYRALVLTTQPNLTSDSTISSFSQNLVSPLLITVTSTGILNKAAQITKFQIGKFVDSFNPLTIDIDIKNTGKSYFRPVGKITLNGPIGKGGYDLLPNIVLVDQTRQLFTEQPSSDSQNNKTLFLPGFYVGKYQIDLDFTLDEGNTKITSQKTFYAMPWKAGMVLVLVIVVGNKLLKSLKKRNKP